MFGFLILPNNEGISNPDNLKRKTTLCDAALEKTHKNSLPMTQSKNYWTFQYFNSLLSWLSWLDYLQIQYKISPWLLLLSFIECIHLLCWVLNCCIKLQYRSCFDCCFAWWLHWHFTEDTTTDQHISFFDPQLVM